jgi:hypothetical protein
MKSVLILFVSLISYSAKAQRTLTLKDPNAQERLLSSDFHAIQVSGSGDVVVPF